MKDVHVRLGHHFDPEPHTRIRGQRCTRTNRDTLPACIRRQIRFQSEPQRDFLDALASELHLTAGTYSEVLEAEARIGAMAAALARTGGVGAAPKTAPAQIGRGGAKSGVRAAREH